MENSPRNQSEEDKALAAKAETLDDDEDEEETKEKKQAPRRAPWVEVEKIKPETVREKPRVSITDRLLERIGAKPVAEHDASDDQEQETVHETEAVVTAHTGQEESPAVNAENQQADLVESGAVAEVAPTIEPTTEPSAERHAASNTEEITSEESAEAAEWESEDTSVDAEVPLVHHSSGEVAPEPEEDHEIFAEIPLNPGPEAEPVVLDVEPELLEDGLAGERPPEPPEAVTPTAARGGFGGGGSGGSFSGGGGSQAERPWYDAAAADRARQAELDDAEYRGQKTGLRHGLAAGLTFGWLFGRRGKKKQAKAFTKELKSKDRELKGLKSEQLATVTHLEAVKRTQEQLSSHIQQRESKPAIGPENVPQRLPEEARRRHVPSKSIERQVLTNTVEIAPITVIKTSEAVPAAEKAARVLEVATVSAASTVVERSTSTISTQEKHVTFKNPEQIKLAPEHQEITEETYNVADGRRVETSAWHRIEIDEKTGKPVENPKVAYGEEFRREQKQEVFSDDTADDSKEDSAKAKLHSAGSKTKSAPQHVAQIGGLAAASFAQEDQTYTESKPTEKGLAAIPLQSQSTSDHKNSNVLRYASRPIVWAIATVIVVVLFILGALR